MLKKIKFTIDPKGGIKYEALEGFVGSNCSATTKEIELLLGGNTSEEGNTDDFYKEDPNKIFVNL